MQCIFLCMGTPVSFVADVIWLILWLLTAVRVLVCIIGILSAHVAMTAAAQIGLLCGELHFYTWFGRVVAGHLLSLSPVLIASHPTPMKLFNMCVVLADDPRIGLQLLR